MTATSSSAALEVRRAPWSCERRTSFLTRSCLYLLSISCASVVNGNSTYHTQFDPLFQTYLNNALGASLNVTFVNVYLDFTTTYTAVQNNQLDFIYTNPSIFRYVESSGCRLPSGCDTLSFSQQLPSNTERNQRHRLHPKPAPYSHAAVYVRAAVGVRRKLLRLSFANGHQPH